MRALLTTIALLLVLPASAAYAVPMCDGPNFAEKDAMGNFVYSEDQESQIAEQKLHSMGIDANNTRFWNGCIQTFVTDASGHTKMRFYDPDTYVEVPVN
ncbi:MAG TPA: hypothetical protein VN109_09045 [Devosia sp.]|jgi:hypothetical protein|nr:hypothetical protein [Devosia sp.]